MVNHALRSTGRERHIESVEHQLRGKARRHRPAHDAAAAGIEHDRQIEEAGPGRDVRDVGHPQLVRALRREVARYQVGCLAAAVAPRGDGELAAAHPGKSGLAHQPGDALAADANARSREVDLDAGGTIGAVRGCMRRTDALGQRAVARCPP